MQEMQKTISEDSIITISNNQISCDLSGESVILNHKDGIYYGLDNIGTTIWNAIQTPETLKEIKNHLLESYEVDSKQLDNDLIELIKNLEEAGLIEIKNV